MCRNDVNLYEVCNTHSQNKLQNAVDDIQEWATESDNNNVSLNTSKTENCWSTLEERCWASLVSLSMVTWLNVSPAQSYLDAISCPTCRWRTTSSISCRKQAVGWENWREPVSLLKTYLRATSPSFTQKTEYACQVWSTSLTIEQSHAVETIQRGAMQIISAHMAYEKALHEHRLVTLQQRRNELCNRLFKDIQNSSHRLNARLPLQHNPGYQTFHEVPTTAS